MRKLDHRAQISRHGYVGMIGPEDRPYVLPTYLHCIGNCNVTLWARKMRVAKLVAAKHMDLPLPGEDECLGYRDGNKLNVSADNLQWSTHASVCKASNAANLKQVHGWWRKGAWSVSSSTRL